ncbi:MAG: NAD(P)-dependent oxidoreductase, partial [Bdellovibrionota bacterium]
DVRGVVVTGTGTEYSDSDVAHEEDELCLPVTPYGLSKLMETQCTAQLANFYKLKTRVARIFIPYGPMDHPQKLFPTVIQSLRDDKKIELSPCEQERDFLYIDDLMSGYQGLMKHIESSEQIFEIFNLSSGEATSLKKLLLTIAENLDVPASLLQFGAKTMRPGEAMRQYGDNQKAKRQLKWQPRSLEEGVKLFLQE